MTLKREEGSQSSSQFVLPMESMDSLVPACPTLAEYLLQCRWDDGKSRQTSTLTISADDSRWKIRISDRDGGRVAFISGSTLEDAFLSLEQALSSGKIEWRKDQWVNKGKR